MRFYVLAFAAVTLFLGLGGIAEAQTDYRETELRLLRSRNPQYLNLLGQRLIEPRHWQLAENGRRPDPAIPFDPSLMRQPYLAYGEKFFLKWTQAYGSMLQQSNLRLPTLGDYLDLHKLSFALDDERISNIPVGSRYSGDFIIDFLRSISRYDLIPGTVTLVQRAKNGDQWAATQLRALAESLLGGTLRTFDTYPSYMVSDWDYVRRQNIGFSNDAMRNLKQNPFLRVHFLGAIPGAPRRYLAEVHFPVGSQVKNLLFSTFTNMDRSMTKLIQKKPTMSEDEFIEEALFIANRFYRDLVSIHGVWDGAGRAAKLARDWVLNHVGIPGPISTPHNDLEISEPELAAQLAHDVKRAALLLKGKSGLKVAFTGGCEGLLE